MSNRRRANAADAEIERERWRNHQRAKKLEDEIFRNATKDLTDGGWWDARMAKPVCQEIRVPDFGGAPDEPDEPAESETEDEKQAKIAEIAKQIESTGTASENPEGD